MTQKQIFIAVGVALVLLVGVFIAGRYSRPATVEIKEVSKETVLVVEKVDEKKLEALAEQVKTALSRLEQLKMSIHKEETKKTFPDGTIEEKKVTDINVDRTVQTVQIQEVEKQVVVVQEKLVDRIVKVENIVEKERKESDRPEFRASLLVGTALRSEVVGPIPFAKPLIIGLSAERRVVGPFFAGAWIMSNTAVGLSVGAEF